MARRGAAVGFGVGWTPTVAVDGRRRDGDFYPIACPASVR